MSNPFNSCSLPPVGVVVRAPLAINSLSSFLLNVRVLGRILPVGWRRGRGTALCGAPTVRDEVERGWK